MKGMYRDGTAGERLFRASTLRMASQAKARLAWGLPAGGGGTRAIN